MKSTGGVVRQLLARRIDCDSSSAIPLSLHLERDLHLSPLELVLVALDIEAATEISLPVEELADVQTVGQFLSFVSRAIGRETPSDVAREADRELR
jgi:acyl carrier protein